MHSSRALIQLALGLVGPGCGVVIGQDAAVDPWTGGKAEVMVQLGYVSFGPFLLGDGHGSADVETELGVARIRWLETAHFRIGSTLAARPLPVDGRKALYAECRQLHRNMPRVPAEPDVLDPWLQVHLFAARLEGVYADFAARAGVDAAWFKDRANAAGRGDGPFLGCKSKFVVLLFEQEGELARYLRRFCACRIGGAWSQRWPRADAMLFATAVGLGDGQLRDPLRLHGHVVHGLVQNLVDAFVASDVTAPFWWREGLAHWYVRRIDPRLVEAGDDETPARAWPEKVAARVHHDLVPEFGEILHWWDGRGRSAADQAILWSLADFLMRQGDAAFARFLRAMREEPMQSRFMPARLVLEWHEAALRGAYGFGIGGLGERWRRFVAANYR